ncbi:MAG: hypothetical protein EHM17_08695 [Verrucomicrobiaceae bacterium]|nr:MAG: hypothetical protein EHM17_08695 [Verrucomicrobiaceae bacterium]
MQTMPAQDRAPVEPATLPAPDQAMEPVKPAIEKLDDTRLRIGGVTFDRKTREIRFPARVNMTEGLLEFIVVHQNGKIHESLLVTDISPTHLNLAFTLLRYPASHELYPLPNDSGGSSGEFPQVPDEVKNGARIAIDVEWNDGAKTRRLPINDWIQHAVKTTAMPQGPWVYGGSFVYDGHYSPETSGDIAAIFIAPSALINYPGEDNRDDTVWIPFPKRVPEVETNVTVIIAPYAAKTSPSKP